MLVLDPSKQPVSGETVGINQVREEEDLFSFGCTIDRRVDDLQNDSFIRKEKELNNQCKYWLVWNWERCFECNRSTSSRDQRCTIEFTINAALKVSLFCWDELTFVRHLIEWKLILNFEMFVRSFVVCFYFDSRRLR